MQVVSYPNEDATYVLPERQGQFSKHLLRGRGQLTLCTDAAETNLSCSVLPVETGECTQASAMQGPPADPPSTCPVSETDDCTVAMEFTVLTATQKQEGVTSILRD